MTSSRKHMEVDYAVVGCGVAGLRAAIELSGAGSVLVLAKSDPGESSTAWARSGIAVALSDEDEIGLHQQDTLAAGDGLCRPEAVAVLVEEGPKYLKELIEWGTEFERSGTKLTFSRAAAHSKSRILHAHGESTGQEILRALMARGHSFPRMRFRQRAFTTGLILEGGRAAGLRFVDETDGSQREVRAGAILLAAGGAGQVYRATTNPAGATGDGMAIAYEAGALLSDMEFVQFYPTALTIKGMPRFILPDTLLSEGGILRNVQLERFMKRYHEAQELSPRDVLARAIASEMQRTKSEQVYLDLTAKSEEFLRKRFPRVYATCSSCGLDLASDLAPVSPAAHFMVGGVKTDLWGRTSIPGLYAAGETAHTGAHGANRLASNALLEGLVFGARSGRAMVKDAPGSKGNGSSAARGSGSRIESSPRSQAEKRTAKEETPPALARVHEIMWQKVGVLRNAKELANAVEQLRTIDLPKCEKAGKAEQELGNLHSLALIIARAALAREESRGSHYRSDFPYRNDEDFGKHSMAKKGTDIRFEA